MQLLLGNPTFTVGYFLQTGHLQSLPFLNHLDKGAGFTQTVVRTGIQPGKSALQRYDAQVLLLQIFLVDGGNLHLSALAGLKGFCILHHPLVIEVKPCNGIV